MKNKISPPMIAGAVVLLVLVLFGVYKLMYASSNQISAANAPAYAKDMMKGGSGAAQSGYGSTYGQNPNQSGGRMPPPPASSGQ